MICRWLWTHAASSGRLPANQFPAIALTAYAGEFDRQPALQLEYQQHIPKPIKPRGLVTIAAHLCGQQQGTAA